MGFFARSKKRKLEAKKQAERVLMRQRLAEEAQERSYRQARLLQASRDGAIAGASSRQGFTTGSGGSGGSGIHHSSLLDQLLLQNELSVLTNDPVPDPAPAPSPDPYTAPDHSPVHHHHHAPADVPSDTPSHSHHSSHDAPSSNSCSTSSNSCSTSSDSSSSGSSCSSSSSSCSSGSSD